MVPVKLEAADDSSVDPVAECVFLGSTITRDGDATKSSTTANRVERHGARSTGQIVEFENIAAVCEVLSVPLLYAVDCWPMHKAQVTDVE